MQRVIYMWPLVEAHEALLKRNDERDQRREILGGFDLR